MLGPAPAQEQAGIPMPSARHSTTSSTGRDACRRKAPSRSQLTPGDTVSIPPNVKHWHGAAPDRLFIHLAFQEVTDQERRQRNGWRR